MESDLHNELSSFGEGLMKLFQKKKEYSLESSVFQLRNIFLWLADGSQLPAWTQLWSQNLCPVLQAATTKELEISVKKLFEQLTMPLT